MKIQKKLHKTRYEFEVLVYQILHASKIGNIARAIAFGFVALKINIPLKQKIFLIVNLACFVLFKINIPLKLSKEVLKLLVK